MIRTLLLASIVTSLCLAPAAAQNSSPSPPPPALPPQPSPPAQAKALPSAADVRLAEAIVFFYVRNDPAAVPEIFAALKNSETIARTGLSRATLAGFFSMLFLQNRARVEGWIGAGGAYPPDSKSVLTFALWQSGNTDLIASLFHEEPGFLRDKPGNLYTLAPSRPVEMDLKWGAFFATGNPGFLATLVDALDPRRPLTGNNQLDKSIRINAAQGLANNLRQHEVLERYLLQRAGEASGPYKQVLDALLASRSVAFKPGPDRDGDFSGSIAMLKLPDKPAADGGASEATALTGAMPQARRGDTIGVSVLFSGMGLQKDLSADVSYDIKVTGPDGTIDPRSTQEGVTALKEKVAGRFNLVDSRSTLSIHFEPDDKPGPYRIDVLLKDNVGGRKVTLTRSIELLDK
ncbi:hypothetical protein [Labrys okinawensis]|uniref:hypothetical protein n=1 Tax=Labrys okinawensis TaxID=346911 RepID=UPI0011B29A67|nr:hypothetical protein [Labrys okinawensis]